MKSGRNADRMLISACPQDARATKEGCLFAEAFIYQCQYGARLSRGSR